MEWLLHQMLVPHDRVVFEADEVDLGNTVLVPAPVFGQSFALTWDMVDRQIMSLLPPGYAFGDSDLEKRLEVLVRRQRRGESGILRANGNLNLLFVPRYAVGTWWSDGHWIRREWKVTGNRLFFAPALVLCAGE